MFRSLIILLYVGFLLYAILSTSVPQWLSHYVLADLLHITGIGHGASGLGVGFQHTPPPEPEPRRPAASSTMGSDILDSNSHELKLEKSNILLLGPTGSGL